MLPQADYAAALARAYNAWLVDQWTSRHDALLGRAVVDGGPYERVAEAKPPGHLGAAHEIASQQLVQRLERVVLGSVARNVLMHARCSVLVMRQPHPE